VAGAFPFVLVLSALRIRLKRPRLTLGILNTLVGQRRPVAVAPRTSDSGRISVIVWRNHECVPCEVLELSFEAVATRVQLSGFVLCCDSLKVYVTPFALVFGALRGNSSEVLPGIIVGVYMG
jgi:hypothetical protein